MTSQQNTIQGLKRLEAKEAEQLISQWNPGDSVVIEVSAERFAEREQYYLPSLARWTFEGLHKKEDGQVIPQFIYLEREGLKINTVRFFYEEIQYGGDDGREKALQVAPWPDVLPFNLDSHLSLSGGNEYKRKYSLLNRGEINTRERKN